MARVFPGRFGRSAPCAGAALALLLLAGVASPAGAEFPGEVFNVYDVDVASTTGGALSSPVLMGLRRANEIYFYGDRPAKMRATVRSDGVLDIQVIDILSGTILLERDALRYETGQDVSGAVAAAALEWMKGLECAGACLPGGESAVALASAAPAAAAPSAPAPAAPVRSAPAAAPAAASPDSWSVPARPSAQRAPVGALAYAIEPAREAADSAQTRVASIDPTAEEPTLANARWVGFTPAVFTGGDGRPGAWISGPFDRKERIGWITDTATGATARVSFLWREGGRGNRTATLSPEAARALGLGQGDVANLAVYLPR